MLDGNLNIQDHSPCLNRMLSSTEDFRDKNFAELLVDSPLEHSRFSDFLTASSASLSQHKVECSAPPCMRVSLLSKAHTRVGVDMFHVCLSHVCGSDKPYHLLAMKQDMEPEHIPDAKPKELPEQLLHRTWDHKNLRGRSTQAASSNGSDCAHASLLQSIPQLSAMMFLIDTSKPQQEVEQVHLNYHRSTQNGDGMPSLRKFVRPTDWETFRRKVMHYVATLGYLEMFFKKTFWAL